MNPTRRQAWRRHVVVHWGGTACRRPRRAAGAPSHRHGRAVTLVVLALAQTALSATNLVVNGGFDDPVNPLAAWQTAYTHAGESWYTNNPDRVAVIPQDGAQSGVLRLRGTYAILNVPGQGVKVDSHPIPLTLDGTRKYRFSARARSTGPACRLLLEGYRWRPDVTPHAAPTIYELRKCYKFTQLYFGQRPSGDLSPVPSQWTEASQVFPLDTLTDMAWRSLAQVQFVIVHVVAIAGKDGDLLIDDIRLEPLPHYQPRTENQEQRTTN